MLIHSIMPEAFLRESPSMPECITKQTEFGLLEGYDSKDGFTISRILSTNPQVYLNSKYTPGSIYTPLK